MKRPSLEERVAAIIESIETAPALHTREGDEEGSVTKSLEERVEAIIESVDTESSSGDEVREETKAFLGNLNAYLDSRKQMDKKYKEVDEFERIASVQLSNDSGGIELPSGDFKPQYQQQTLEGNPVSNLKELYDAANKAKPVYESVITRIFDQVCQECKGDGESTVTFPKLKDQYRAQVEAHEKVDGESTVTFAKLKGQERAQAKAHDDYDQRTPGPGVAWLFDIVRGCIEFTSSDQILKFLEKAKEDESIHIVKAKNRFAIPTLTGYRDFNLHIQIDVGKDFKHICEIQVHHMAMHRLSEELDAHKYYEFFRKYYAGATGSLTDRLDDLVFISEGKTLDDALLNKLLGSVDEDADRLERLADLFQDQLCEYHWALRVSCKMLKIYKRNLGKDDAKVATTYNRMGLVCRIQGNLVKALDLFEISLKIRQKTLGEDHSSVSSTINNMGLIHEAQGNFVEALDLYQKSLKLYLKNHGEEHLSVADSYNNMGGAYFAQSNLVNALDLYEMSLKIKLKTVGEDHTTVASTYNNIAVIFQEQGKFDKAVDLYQKSVNIALKCFGEEHSSVAEKYCNMAGAFQKQENFVKALELYEMALNIFLNIFGEEHPHPRHTKTWVCYIKNRGTSPRRWKCTRELMEHTTRTRTCKSWCFKKVWDGTLD